MTTRYRKKTQKPIIQIPLTNEENTIYNEISIKIVKACPLRVTKKEIFGTNLLSHLILIRLLILMNEC